jgi:hypothetical protein
MTAVPVIDDVALTFVQEMEHLLDAGFVSTPVLGLDGDVQQRSNRRSHRMRIAGLLVGPEEQVKTDLEKLQQKAADGAEVIFTADIVAALELQKVVVRSLRVLARAGTTPSYSYEIELAENPPLPPPAQVSAFGGLDDFGFGDLGFDTDILGDLADLAGEVASAVETAVDVIGALDSLSALGNLSFDGVLAPLDQIGTSLAAIGSRFGDAGGALAGVFGQ